MSREIRKVVVLGANGAMGSGSGETFARRGIPTVFLARDAEKAQGGLERAKSLAKADAVAEYITVGSYDEIAEQVKDADLIFEAVAERMELKRHFFEQVDEHRKPDSIVATVSSGLSIEGMVEGRSESFRKHFMGIHFYNPPNVIVGCEVIPNSDTDPDLLDWVSKELEARFGREVVETADTPAFAGNRIGFKVLNEVAILAQEHGVVFMDMLIGPHTGRAMPPLATVDLVGWDVHKAIVDNVHANTKDEAHELFELPGYMQVGVAEGRLGSKTPAMGGFVKRPQNGDKGGVLILDPRTGKHTPLDEIKIDVPDCVTRMKVLNRGGRYEQAMAAFLEAKGWEADLMRKVILGYVSYGLNRVGTVVREARDVDRIMGFGFNWAPPSVLVDYMGIDATIKALETAKLEVPTVLTEHAGKGGKLFDEPHVDRGRFFVG